MARLTYDLMETEVTRRLGNHSYTGFDSRVQRWIEQSYYRLAKNWHHPELDAYDGAASLTSGNNSLSLTAGTFHIFALDLLDASDAYVKKLTPKSIWTIRNRFSATNAEPSEYARFADTIYLNCNVDATYKLGAFYYKDPTAPNFGAGAANPDIDEHWDEAIMDLALHLGAASIGRPDLAADAKARVDAFLDEVPNPRFKDYIKDQASVSRTNDSHMRAQG